MSDNQLAYLPRLSAKPVSTSDLSVAVGIGATEFGTTGFVSAGTAATAFTTMGSASANAAVLGAKASSQPKQGHRDLAADVMNIDARSWASRPRRLSLAP